MAILTNAFWNYSTAIHTRKRAVPHRFRGIVKRLSVKVRDGEGNCDAAAAPCGGRSKIRKNS
jgi:hypothetical protein